MHRKQILLKGLKSLIIESKKSDNVYQVQTDINRCYWLHKGVIYNSDIFNLRAATKVKVSTLSKDTVYYITDMLNKDLFNV